MDTQWVVVFPQEVIGFFDSEVAAKDYVLQAFNFDREEMYRDTTWSIEPMRAP